jgi:hypothetical protein
LLQEKVESEKDAPPMKFGHRPLHISGDVALSNNLDARVEVDR